MIRPAKQRPASLLLVALVLLAGGTGSAAVDPYTALQTHKALAIARDPILQAVGVADAEPNEVSASMQALTACGQRRTELGIAAPCELVRLDHEEILTGGEIKARVPHVAHPLFLWRVTSPTAEVYLAGSVHALKASLYPLPEPFEAAFQRADTLVVEVDTVSGSTHELQQTLMRYVLLPAGVTLADVVAPATVERLNTHLDSQGIPPASLASLKPVMIATQLSVTRLMALGYLPDHGLEQHFISRAGNRDIAELETVDAQFAILTEIPMALQEQLLLDTLDQLPELESTIGDLIVAWLSGNDADLLRLLEQQSAQSDAYQAFMDRLLDERNQAMAERIAGFLDESGSYFVLVGAAHLAGTGGIVRLLENDGHTVHRLTSTETF